MNDTAQTPAHGFIAPRLTALINDAAAHGIAREVAVAVVTDIITTAPFNTSAPDPMADSAPHPTEPGQRPESELFQEKNELLEQIVQPSQII